MENKSTTENTTKKNKEKIIRKLQGEIVSDKSDKMIVVLVTRVKIHPKYGKRYKVSKKFHVHDPKNQYKVGEIVEFKEIRPISKTKKWIVIKKV